MNAAYELNQLSGNVWATPGPASLLFVVQPSPGEFEQLGLLDELAGLEAQMARFEGEQDELIDRIRTLYVIPDERSVISYLRAHRRIPQLIAEAAPHLGVYFGDVVLSLRAVADERGWEMLYVFVQWEGEPEEALARLNAFDDAWWLRNSSTTAVSVTFTYNLV